MKKYSAIITALCLGVFALGSITPLRAAGVNDALPAKEVTQEDAAKKYPPPKNLGHYPEGVSTSTTTGGFFQSPYSSRVYDCRKVKKGTLLLDDSVNKIFVRP
jgi:hypothetical protein